MRRYLFCLFGLLLSVQHGKTQSQFLLSDSARISVMTVAPGPFVYSTFGHSAIRVRDPLRQFDRCFNYGTFDFEQPNFLLKFCRGRLMYFLDMEPYRSFEYGNLYDHRPMQEQTLRLDSTQRQHLFDLLRDNLREDKRYYKYDFFYDNCATRIRDMIQSAFVGGLNYDSTGLPPHQTMRQLLQPYLKEQPWMRFGINLILGQAADRRALATDYMFLPDYVHDMFARARIGDSTLLVQSERAIPDPSPLPAENAGFNLFDSPFWVMLLVALLGMGSMLNARAARIFDGLFWFVLGVAGLIIFLLWFATDHSATKLNWNMLWALPTHLFFFWRKRGVNRGVENYFTATALLAALALLLWAFIPQEMPVEAIPIALLVVFKGGLQRFWKRELQSA